LKAIACMAREANFYVLSEAAVKMFGMRRVIYEQRPGEYSRKSSNRITSAAHRVKRSMGLFDSVRRVS
jgi:hypothetical protein